MKILQQVNDTVNGIVWGIPTIILIGLVGLYYTVILKGVQFTKFGYFIKHTIGDLFKKAKLSSGKGDITSLQAAMTSISAVVGSGNIAGVATAIASGGPGALFWMVVAALIGMATKYAEIILGMLYRKENPDGSVEGGAMYYLARGLNCKWLGTLFAFLVIPFAFVISPVVDTNTIAVTLEAQFSIKPIFTGIVLAVICGIIVFGGLKRIGSVCEWIAPFMGGMYILAGLVIIVLNIEKLPFALWQIIRGAFNPRAVTGGVVGTVFMCMRYGVARGMYSNEAGVGTAAMIHSGAKVDHPVQQGMWGPVEVFIDTVVVCSITALSIVLSGLWRDGQYDGAVLTMRAFEKLLPGSLGTYICLGAIILFGFSCLISYFTYAQRAATYLFGSKSTVVIKILWVLFILIGSVSTLGFAWDLADTFNGLMIIPNLIGLIFLSKKVVCANRDYWEKQ
ncbi:MAG: alanine/glycine:cation symporter family protein [Candidatus Limivicinus sp.]|jgi:AGCS family alanine or glycine:cation symporter